MSDPSDSLSDSPQTSPPLWRQLQLTASALASIRGGVSGSVAFEAVEPGLRPGVQALGFQVLRWLGRAEALRRQLAKRTPPPAADALLCTALALAWDADRSPYEPFTLVDQAVEAAKRNPATRAQASFINACLRRFLRERDELVAITEREPVAQWNHPRWWIERLRRQHPRDWQRVLTADNNQAPMTLRVNLRKTGVAAFRQGLAAAGLQSLPVGASGLQLERARPVAQIPGFAQGECSVQDAAAQIAAPLLLSGLAPRQGAPLRLLDACAAPGGKTAHLLEAAGSVAIEVTALEVDAARSRRIDETLSRLGLAAKVLVADASRPSDWWDGQAFDAILLDAPCTASGIVRRHPDVRWLRRESDIEQLALQQAMLLAALWPLVRPGGRLLYCTCSVFLEEGAHQIGAFLEHNTDGRLLPSPGHLLPQSGVNARGVPDNALGDHDGFFYALLEKLPR
ncbi:16S rRNA (cytosine(967)-C(5))-methyltransferase RsmB [Variovorax saccharolyticus]|uniref:16S rRNA (cytosine(967)-C(5))-methyltransferase RsmB n=1 Tax=Variovorax saccharolyticus TaxID=3053516 RepID=UPI0025778CD5|nr:MULTISPECIES: 16S rRNA (cytosine(967)-C(5))-methyltransferase RsmB [unclassified Variovorax]MDM0019653.1 16S rRNA (cytosine(967)-C(5))-methyltransferase RsmB [Variovorax sp. J22R187]MDM0027805.1 16S rRNA (cytosine(967)-C(5))-methyltransferase RsmB [Variovorax sp. J31P216]